MKRVVLASLVLAVSPYALGESVTLEYQQVKDTRLINGVNVELKGSGKIVAFGYPLRDKLDLEVSHGLYDASFLGLTASGSGTTAVLKYEYPLSDNEHLLLGAGIDYSKANMLISGTSISTSDTDGIFIVGLTSNLSEELTIRGSISWQGGSHTKEVSGSYMITENNAIGLKYADSDDISVTSAFFTHSF